MNKVFMAAATALMLCAPVAPVATAQGRSVRVGPLTDETTSEAPARKEKQPAASAESKQVKNDKSSEAKKDAKSDSKNAARPVDKGSEKKTVALSSNTSAPVNAATPISSSDAPAKSTSDIVVPILAPSNASPSKTVPTSAAAPATTSPSNVVPSPLASVPPVTYSPAPVPALTAIYRIGVGDVLDIRLLNQTNTRESTLYTVMAGGLLEYPLAGEALVVTGMTTEELGARLSLSLKRRAVYDKPQLVVSVRDYASHTVLVSGLVSDPGAKLLRREAVPLYVVIAEAQPLADAGRALVISHTTGQTETVDLADAASLNVLVHAGDVVNVQARPKEFLYLGGEIALPGQKDFHAGMTLTQAVLASGGVTRLAGPKIKVSRQGADGRLISTEYNLSEIESGIVPDPRLQPGDRVEVSARKR